MVNAVALFCGTVMPSLVVLSIVTYIYRRRRAKRMGLMGGRTDASFLAYMDKVKPQISLRLEQEHDRSRGSNVWFSRHIQRGRFNHWILIINDTKYELRQNKQDDQFYVNVAACELDHERREAALHKQGFPEYDGHYVCLIGWTQKSKDEITRIAQQVGRGCDYSKFTNNCQHYLRLLADQILVHEKAADYPWFYDNTKTEYQNSRIPPPPPEELLAMQKQQQQAVQQNMQINQLNMNMVNQTLMMQNQQNVALNQANMQAMNNPAMNPAAFGMVGGAPIGAMC